MSFELCFSPEFFFNEGEPYDGGPEPCERPTSVWHAILSMPEDEWAAMESMSTEDSLRDAPMAACAMVLAEGGVEQSQAGPILSALSKAYQQIDQAGLAQAVNIEIHLAWRAMTESRFEQFIALLEQAAKKLALSIDGWEKSRLN